MSDNLENDVSNFFNNDSNENQSESQPTETEPSEPVEKVKVGEAEYTQEELNRLVGLGKLAVESETKFNTKVDKIWPEYTKKSQKLAELEKEIEGYRAEQANKAKLPENEEQAIREAKEAAKKLGIVTDDAFEDRMGKVFTRYYQQERQAERLVEQGQDLEKKIDGSDGRPAFVLTDVLEYMRDNMGGQGNLDTAYKLMHEDALDKWRETELGKSRKQGMTTATIPGGSIKTPPQVKVTDDNLDSLVAEMFNQQ